MFEALSLNDAVYIMTNQHPNQWCITKGADGNALNFNKTNCPLLRERNPSEVVSYRDWAAILAGNIKPTFENNRPPTHCVRESTGSSQQYAKYWGYTFGKPKGPKGRPISESKALDTSFYFYKEKASGRGYAFADGNYLSSPTNYANDGGVVRAVATNIGSFDYLNGKTSSLGHGGIFTIPPGIYMMVSQQYYAGQAGFDISEDNGKTWIEWINYVYSASYSYYTSNTLFFVDSPVLCKDRTASSYYLNAVFSLVPDGYWE